MNLKLTHSQFFALYDLLQKMVIAAKPSGITAKLLHSILISVYKKFYTKAFDKNKKQYSVSLNDEEACAWWLFFDACPLPDNMKFEINLVGTISNSIHQKFAA